jgi:hypothetical protein
LHPNLSRDGEFIDTAYGAFIAYPDVVPDDADDVRVPLKDATYHMMVPARRPSPPHPWASRQPALERSRRGGGLPGCGAASGVDLGMEGRPA